MGLLKVRVAGAVALVVYVVGFTAGGASASVAHQSGGPALGPNVIVLSPSMPQATIQQTLDTIATQQVPNQFGTQRYAILFEPGTYGSAASPLVFQLGYYTQVAGLGAEPADVVINGAIDVFNQCSGSGTGRTCTGLTNFWRSLSNLTLNMAAQPSTPVVPDPGDSGGPSCDNSAEMWAVSQAAPMRRVIINGLTTLTDYCNANPFVSGGFLADDEFQGSTVINASQQQFFTRNSDIDGWTNGVWNQVFLGDNGAPPTAFGPGTNQYTTLASTPVSEEEPFLYTDSNDDYNVFAPAVQRASIGPDYAGGATAGTSIPIRRFFVADPRTPVFVINAALARGQNLILTPGIYNLHGTIEVTRPDTVVLGLGFPTLIPRHGNVSMQTASVPGIKLSGMIFDAGMPNSPALLVVGSRRDHRDWHAARTDDPTLVQDVFFRVGGAEPGQVTDSLVVNTDDTILDDVSAYGLFVEHYQKFEVIWNGQNGEDVFFQNEMPYDPPSQSAWMSSPTTDGYAAFLVTPRVQSFQGYGMGSYSFFNQGVPIMAAQAFQAPDRPDVQFTDLLTVFLNANGGSGGISSVINGVGGASTAGNADTPVDVLSYP